MSISENLLPEFEHEMSNTRKMLERIPDDRLSWKPHEKSMSLGRLAGHVAEMSDWANHTLKFDSFDIKPREDGGYEAYTVRSREEALKQFDAWVAEATEALKNTSDEAFGQTWRLTSKGETWLSMPRGAVLRTIVMNHMIHHRAQLGVYLRLNEVSVPGMYGPSADD